MAPGVVRGRVAALAAALSTLAVLPRCFDGLDALSRDWGNDAGVSDGAPADGDQQKPDAADAACIPECNNKQCGDNGCGGVCGSCQTPNECTQAGQCSTCVPWTSTPAPDHIVTDPVRNLVYATYSSPNQWKVIDGCSGMATNLPASMSSGMTTAIALSTNGDFVYGLSHCDGTNKAYCFDRYNVKSGAFDAHTIVMVDAGTGVDPYSVHSLATGAPNGRVFAYGTTQNIASVIPFAPDGTHCGATQLYMGSSTFGGGVALIGDDLFVAAIDAIPNITNLVLFHGSASACNTSGVCTCPLQRMGTISVINTASFTPSDARVNKVIAVGDNVFVTGVTTWNGGCCDHSGDGFIARYSISAQKWQQAIGYKVGQQPGEYNRLVGLSFFPRKAPATLYAGAQLAGAGGSVLAYSFQLAINNASSAMTGKIDEVETTNTAVFPIFYQQSLKRCAYDFNNSSLTCP